LVCIATFVAIARAAGRSRELFVLSVRGGQTRLVRGRVPPALLEALSDVMRRSAVQNATLRAVRGDGRAQLQASGLDEYALQRARNVLGTFPLAKLLGAQTVRA
jgi:hypothetical protein